MRRQSERPLKQPRHAGLRLPLDAALRERVKELRCLYGIAELLDKHGDRPEQFLQEVVELLPISWQFPSLAMARIRIGPDRYATPGFRLTRWRQTAPIQVDGEVVGSVDVVYRRRGPWGDAPAFLDEEEDLIRAVAERLGRWLMHSRDQQRIQEAQQALQAERNALITANAALRAVLEQIEEQKREARESVLANLRNVVMPLVWALESTVTGPAQDMVTLLRRHIEDIAAPFAGELERLSSELTPTEFSICAMLRQGLTTKEIARVRAVSPATVRRHRENIRAKLGLTNQSVNLTSWLRQLKDSGDQAEKPGSGQRATRR